MGHGPGGATSARRANLDAARERLDVLTQARDVALREATEAGARTAQLQATAAALPPAERLEQVVDDATAADETRSGSPKRR